MEIRDLIEKIEALLDKIKDVDRQQRRKIRDCESLTDAILPPLIPGSGKIDRLKSTPRI
jgi:hypothetical protein